MIVFNANDADLALRAGEMVHDFCLDRENGYSEEDCASATKLGKLRRGLLVTGDEQTQEEAGVLLKEVIMSELDNWVANASQRLINRACGALGFPELLDPAKADHGSNPGDHALVQDWVYGIFVLRCCTCARLFKV